MSVKIIGTLRKHVLALPKSNAKGVCVLLAHSIISVELQLISVTLRVGSGRPPLCLSPLCRDHRKDSIWPAFKLTVRSFDQSCGS